MRGSRYTTCRRGKMEYILINLRRHGAAVGHVCSPTGVWPCLHAPADVTHLPHCLSLLRHRARGEDGGLGNRLSATPYTRTFACACAAVGAHCRLPHCRIEVAAAMNGQWRCGRIAAALLLIVFSPPLGAKLDLIFARSPLRRPCAHRWWVPHFLQLRPSASPLEVSSARLCRAVSFISL